MNKHTLIVGPAGSGKTSLVKHLLGFCKKDKIEFLQEGISEASIGFCFVSKPDIIIMDGQNDLSLIINAANQIDSFYKKSKPRIIAISSSLDGFDSDSRFYLISLSKIK